ncbi:Exodeoxyribonuclease I subunit D [bacterium A37T11]|nr:Exodeoxyribonuclease I subunit D [bacterium A37T11]
MFLLHTADWHLGKRLEKFSRLEEQREVLEEIIRIADERNVDAVLVAGDLFDAFNPSTEAVELLYKSLKRLTNDGRRPVIAIAGNHDSPDRIEAPDPLARACGILFAGYPSSQLATGSLESGISISQSAPGFIELRLPGFDYPLRVILAPYVNEYRLQTFLGIQEKEAQLRDVLQNHWQGLADRYCDENGVNVLLAHFYVMKKGDVPPEEPEDEKPILHVGGAQAIYSENIPPQMQYVALGHLHRYHRIDKVPCPVVYSSSPLAYSFAEAGQQKQVLLVDLKPGTPASYEAIPLNAGRTLFRKRFESSELALEWLLDHPNALVELTLVSDTYLASDLRRQLLLAHQGIVTIIPEVHNPELLRQENQHIDLGKDMDELFAQYFSHRYGQQPDEAITNLFKEIRAEQTEE